MSLDANEEAPAAKPGNALKTGFLLALAVLIVDQVHKWWMIAVLGIRLEQDRFTVLPFMDVVYVLNKGISYGLFTQDDPSGQIALSVFSFVVAATLIYWLARAYHSLWSAIGIGLIAGGAVGNGIDRLHLGGVADFIQLHAFGFYWYVFNIADVAIVAGVLALLYDSFWPSRKPSGAGRKSAAKGT